MNKRILYCFLVVFIFFSNPFLAQAATLYFSAVDAKYTTDQIIKLNVIVDGKGENYDTVQANISFPADVLQVQSISINPAFSYASPDNTYNNANGIISYGAGIPGGSNQAANFATVVFTVKKEGNATVSLLPSSLVLSGGNNILAGAGGFVALSIVPKTAPTPAPVVTAKPAPKEKPTSVTLNQNSSETKNTAEEKNSEDQETNPAVAGLEAANVPIATNAGQKGFLAGYWRFIWPALSIALLLLISYGLYKKFQKQGIS